jgi:putative salt-induced outer membrane protein YdiY
MTAPAPRYGPGAQEGNMLVSALLCATVAHAEDSAFAGTAKPVEDPAEGTDTHLTAEAGGTYTSGNAAFYAVTALAKFDHTWAERNKFSANAGFQFGGSKVDANLDGFLDADERATPYEENARRIAGEVRYDRFLTDHDALYALAGAFHDPWAGYDLRSHEQIGYSRLLVKTENTQFRAELGADVAQENYVTGVVPNYEDILAARILLGLDVKFNEHTGFSETFETYENVLEFEDVRILNTATFTSTLTKVLALKLSHILAWDNVPVDGYAELDQTGMVTFVASIL